MNTETLGKIFIVGGTTIMISNITCRITTIMSQEEFLTITSIAFQAVLFGFMCFIVSNENKR